MRKLCAIIVLAVGSTVLVPAGPSVAGHCNRVIVFSGYDVAEEDPRVNLGFAGCRVEQAMGDEHEVDTNRLTPGAEVASVRVLNPDDPVPTGGTFTLGGTTVDLTIEGPDENENFNSQVFDLPPDGDEAVATVEFAGGSTLSVTYWR